MVLSQSLQPFKLLCFDCYGTIIDWETAMYEGIEPFLSRTSKSSKWTKEEALVAFSSVERNLVVQHPDLLYSAILERTFEEFAKRLEVELKDGEATAFAGSIKDWVPFPDSVEALLKLQSRYKIVILSNIDKVSFLYTLKRLSPFVPDLVLTAQDIGSYKPSQNNFLFMLDAVKKKFAVEKDQVLVTAQSLWADHQPANVLDLRSVWINRSGQSVGVELQDVHYDWTFETLEEMARAVESDFQTGK